MDARRQNDLNLAEQAAEWAATLDGADARQHAEFVAWLKQSARHVEEFLLASALYRELDGVDAQRRESIEALMREGNGNVVTIGTSHLTPALSVPGEHRGRRKIWWGAAAACATIALGIAWSLWETLGWQGYQTQVGEQRAVELPDGSLINLNTQSSIQVRYSAAGREIRLRGGEALFNVATDATRPFRVRTDGAVIQALGTQFNVRQRTTVTQVTVIEGAVRVAAAGTATASSAVSAPQAAGTAPNTDLSAGQEASVTGAGEISAAASTDVAKAVAWRQRRLVFSNDRLADVAAEFNRYNRSPRIRVEDERASERRLTAVFDADAPQSLVRFLAGAEELSVDRDGDTVVIRWRFDRP